MKLRESAKEITDIEIKPNVRLTEANILMIPDFRAFEISLGRRIYHEYKGMETDVWRLKRRLWLAYGPAPLWVYKGYGKSLRVTEELVPKPRSIFD